MNYKYKVCMFVVGTNRPEYLTRALTSQRNLDWSGIELTKTLCDDMPLGRDDAKMVGISEEYKFDNLYLANENKGIGRTWQMAFDSIKGMDYDYIFHQEDDVVILEHVSMLSMIRMFESRPDLSQLVFKRQPWYPHETQSVPLDDDWCFENLRGEFNLAKQFFTPICSLYPSMAAEIDYQKWYRETYPDNPVLAGGHINEWYIGKMFWEQYKLQSMHVKGIRGQNLINHIGKYTIGKKILPHEQGYANFAGIDPTVKYWSGTHVPCSEPFVPPN